MSYKIVFFDIDGTLINEKKEIPADTVKAIRELKGRGVEPVIATGRAPYFIKPLAEKLGIESYVTLNGAYVVYKGKPLYKREIPKSHLETLVTLAAQHNHALVFEGEHSFFASKENHPFVKASVESLKVDELPSYNPDFWRTDSVYQVFLHCESHEEHLYESKLPGLKLIRWHPQAMDVLPTDGSKAQGIEALLRELGLTAADAVAFGDGLNDKEMLDLVGFGVAMGNSHEELLPFADFVTTHVDEKGIRNGLVEAGLL
ncbi:Cof-type HAD-IIB family hydrolase [Paenibacillus sediminis]|uniref:Cof subfamily protein (Haloacid dehalogenase superfamily) n=1 Tax=Paenibacillus sediminis TaxID=664909 RepID=A0ABS4H509_9BACL|nr:Cof-type HAD-IIB family hydrolase [Paenibacillus sediminis]MBP1937606.1 Cof subfamily protein (haloacid dehalogenase superfamily) [Paenibacillus sediminis]